MALPGDNFLVQRSGGRTLFRFRNSIPNIGAGPLQIRARVEGDRTIATQEVIDEAGNVLASKTAGVFEYHADHGHTHIDNVTSYVLRQGGLDGPIVASSSKVSFCLEDTRPWIGSPRSLYPQCTPTLQGISSNWVDVYDNDVPGQELDVTGRPAGEYTLVVTIDPSRKFFDANGGNNTAWVRIRLDPNNLSATAVATSR